MYPPFLLILSRGGGFIIHYNTLLFCNFKYIRKKDEFLKRIEK